MIPTDQGLDTGQAALFHLRLIIEQELVRLYCLTEVFFHGCSRIDGSLQCRGEKTCCIATIRFSLMHRNGGVLRDIIRAYSHFPEDGDSPQFSLESLHPR